MAVDRETLIRRLETICTSACSGDTEAVAKVKQIKSAAEAGDARAKLALAGLRHLYWSKQQDTHSWNTAESIYRQTAKGNPKAKAVVAAIIDRAKNGDETAVATWGRLKAIHGSTKPGALFPAGPGQARIGGYGMPHHNQAGVVVGGPTLIGAGYRRPLGAHPGSARVSGYGYHGGGLGSPSMNAAHRLVGGPTLIGGYGYHGGGLGASSRNAANRLVGGPTLIGVQSGPSMVGGQSGPNLVGGYGYHGGGLGSPSRNHAARLVGRNTMQGEVSGIGGYGYHGGGLGASSKNSANRLVGGPTLIGGYAGGHESLVGGYPGGYESLVGGLPVRNRHGLVVGRQPIVVGDISATQVAELRDLMERAARARVALRIAASIARSFREDTTVGPSTIQQATLRTIKSAAETTSVVNPYTSKYGVSILAAPTGEQAGVEMRGTL